MSAYDRIPRIPYVCDWIPSQDSVKKIPLYTYRLYQDMDLPQKANMFVYKRL